MTALVVWLVLAAPAQCGSIAPHGSPDPGLAAAYLDAASAAEERGDHTTAIAGYTEALRHDPANSRAKTALEKLCESTPSPAAELSEAIALMRDGRREEAIARFEELRSHGKNPEATLLLGICLYEDNDDARAEPLLREALTDAEFAPSAELFLGPIALRRGDSREAQQRFERARAQDPELSAPTAGLMRLSAQGGRLLLGASAEGGYDSNVDLAPGTTAFPSGSGNAVAVGELRALLRPLRNGGPFLLTEGGYRKNAVLSAYDVGTVSAGGGYEARRGAFDALVAYRFDYVTFGLSPFSSTHRVNARANWTASNAALAAEYQIGLERYLTPDTARYSGTRHTGRLLASYLFEGGGSTELLYEATRDLTAFGEFSFIEHGPGIRLFVPVGARVRLYGQASLHFRSFDEVDPDYTIARVDRLFDGRLRGELDVDERLSVFANVDGRISESNIPELSSSRLTVTLGLSFAMGVL